VLDCFTGKVTHHLPEPSKPFSTSVATKMAQRKRTPEVGIRVAYRVLTSMGTNPIALLPLQLSGTVEHASTIKQQL